MNVGSTPTLIGASHSVAAPHWGAPFAISETIGRNGPTMGAPNLTGNAPRLPLIEKITPKSVTVPKVLNTRAVAQTRVITVANRAVRKTRGYVNGVLMRQRGRRRFWQEIGDPIIDIRDTLVT